MAGPKGTSLHRFSHRSLRRLARASAAFAAIVAVWLSPSLRSRAFVSPHSSESRPRLELVAREEARSKDDFFAQSVLEEMDSLRRGPKQIKGPEFWGEVERYGLQHVLDSNGGMVKVDGLLPGVLATQTLAKLEGLDESEWLSEDSKGTVLDQALDWVASVLTQSTRKTADYSFATYRGDAIKGAAGVIESLVDDAVISLKAARYRESNHIEKHGDRGSTIAGLCTQTPLGHTIPVGTRLHRKIALIWYLTPDWKESYGGCLVDHGVDAKPRTIVPQFNSAVIFEVPRDHEVTRMAAGSPSRHTLFGWFSKPESGHN